MSHDDHAAYLAYCSSDCGCGGRPCVHKDPSHFYDWDRENRRWVPKGTVDQPDRRPAG